MRVSSSILTYTESPDAAVVYVNFWKYFGKKKHYLNILIKPRKCGIIISLFLPTKNTKFLIKFLTMVKINEIS